MYKINLKPLSVNEAWKGRRFKTSKYKSYIKSVLILLPKLDVPNVKLKLELIAGFSNEGADLDNIAKLFIDILQKKYDFNDSMIYEILMKKEITTKGNEFIKFKLSEAE